jgi:soluble lytic murein transglycosylase
VVLAARTELTAGSPWRATRLLAPILADPATRTSESEWLAARAAAEWGGWEQVRQILARSQWLDSLYDGSGRELLARAALALGDDSTAAVEARRALVRATAPAAVGVRRVLLARALDRLGQLSDAGAAYAAAAGELPPIGDWLRLRALTALATGTGVVSVGPGITDPLVLAHAPAGVAAALERRRAFAPARDAYLALGDTVAALRMATALGADSSTRRAIVSQLAQPLPSLQLAQLLALLDQAYQPLTPAEQLIAARAAARAGQAPRAVAGFDAALARGLGTSDDRFSRAQMLVRSGQVTAGAAAFRALTSDRTLGVQALYEEGRALLRLPDHAAAIRVLGEVVRHHPHDSTQAASALFLLAGEDADRGDDQAARRRWDELARRYPSDRLAAPARFQADIITFIRREFRRAARGFDSLRAPEAGVAEANAAGYWAGRAWAAVGDTGTARARWREVFDRAPGSYYAGASARQLGIAAPPIREPGPPTPVPAFVSGAEGRIALLDSTGLDLEAGWERAALGAATGGSDTLVAAAGVLLRVDAPALAARLARAALLLPGVDSARALRLLYPLDDADALSREAHRRNIDPAFAAALIRQESGFDPEAISGAGARGMMQVMPSVGAAIARRLHFPMWDPVLLFQPDVNLEIGMAQLRNLFDRFGDPVRVLAAYNAGGSKVLAWEQRAGVGDPDLFIERIPFPETRDYVRTILRNREMYGRLYGW